MPTRVKAFLEHCAGNCAACLQCRHCQVIRKANGKAETVLKVYCDCDPEVQPMVEDINDLHRATLQALFTASRAAGGRG